MANTSTSTYMLLVLPTPEVQIGPTWAQNLIDALSKIDSHDHSQDNGVKVTPAGMLINSTLDMGAQSLINALAVALSSASATDSDPGKIYRVGQNLWYNNAAGASVQITSGTSLAVPGTGAISADSPASYPYSVLGSDAQKVLLIDTSSARTINLPAATVAMFFMLKDSLGSAQTNNISIVPDGTDTIDGSNSTFLINANYGAIGLVSDGISAWYVV